MQTYAEFSPTSFDRKGAFLDDRQDWLVLPVSRNRDSGEVSNSNFESAEKLLSKADAEGETWETHRFGHWGPGWYEIIIVKPGTASDSVAKLIERRFDDYPVLDENDYSKRDWEAACEAWENTDKRNRIQICARHKVSIFAARRNEIPQGLPYYDDFYESR